MSETTPPQPPSNEERRADAAASGDEAYRVKVGGFEGPLDLLLHLVRVNEVDITDIPIVEITDADDPRAELAEQLLEYQRYKQAAETLGAMDSRRTLIWTRDGQIPEEFSGEEWLTADLFDLMSSFRKLLSRLGEEARLHLKRERVSVADKIAWLAELLEERRSVDFLEALGSLPGVADRIAAFLALLEMMRLGMVVALQHRQHGDIRLALRAEEASPSHAAASDSAKASPHPGEYEAEP